MNDAAIILAGGAQQIGASLPLALAVALGILFAALVLAGVFFVALFKGRAQWRALYGEDTQPIEVGDDTIAEFGPEAELEREIKELIRKYGDD